MYDEHNMKQCICIIMLLLFTSTMYMYWASAPNMYLY